MGEFLGQRIVQTHSAGHPRNIRGDTLIEFGDMDQFRVRPEEAAVSELFDVEYATYCATFVVSNRCAHGEIRQHTILPHRSRPAVCWC